MDTAALAAGETVEVVPGVHLTQLAAGEEMSAQYFRIDPGADVPEHSHHHEQIGFVFQGTLSFELSGEEIGVGPNESFAIPGGEPHAAVNRGEEPVRGIDVFAPPRTDPDWGR